MSVPASLSKNIQTKHEIISKMLMSTHFQIKIQSDNKVTVDSSVKESFDIFLQL